MSKKLLGIASMFAAMSAMSVSNHGSSPAIREEYLPKETEEKKKKRLKAIDKKLNENKGLKEFFYGENSLWALNQKNADKKAKKNNWI